MLSLVPEVFSTTEHFSLEVIMNRTYPLLAVTAVLVLAAAAGAQWTENFDSYSTGGIAGTGGWDGWEGDETADAFVEDSVANSSPNGLAIIDTSDIVHQFDESEGSWIMTAWQYIPSGGSGSSYYILLNTYFPEGGSHDWSLDLKFNLADNTIEIVEGSAVGVFTPDAWMEIKVEIDLANNEQSIYYDGTLLETIPWQTTGVNEIAALDLFGNGASTIFYDDLDLAPGVGFDQTTWGSIKTTTF